ncbi:MAG: phenylalanine--tRNA ligase subunit beta [Planctomycetota bacterium]|nr:phenylalanine--tRNA ligase subunit beta [Planctomycetota bacterium]
MKISLKWINDFVDISDKSADEISSLLSVHTAEVEGIEYSGESIKDVVVAEVIDCIQHPDADKLSVTTLNYGGEDSVQVVCGAPNVRTGLKVALAPVGSLLPGGLKIKKAKLRGQLSQGMICSDSELELSDESDGIKELAADAPVGDRLIDYLALSDAVLELDNKSLTHRPDLWGHYGFARELSSILKRPLRQLSDGNFEWPQRECSFSIALDTDGVTNSYQLAELNITAGPQPSPAWMQQRLLAVGQRPVNDVVDVSNYVMLEIGQPSHAFDADKLSGNEISVRRATEQEKFVALDDSESNLNKSDYVIADIKGAIALAGVIGSKSSDVGEGTNRIVLECASFDATTIRRTALSHNLRSEASARFEKSLDPNYVSQASERVCELLCSIRDDITVVSKPVHNSLPSAEQISLKLDCDRARNLLGMDIDNAEIKDNLSRLGFNVEANGSDFTVEVPSYRATKDISLEIDLIEEVGRISGYDKIVPRPLEAPVEMPRQSPSRQLVGKLLARLIAVHNAHETQSYSFVADEWAQVLGQNADDFIQIDNPVQDGVSLMRRTPALSLLSQIVANEREFVAGRLCEFAKGYLPNPNGGEAIEKRYLAMVAWQPKTVASEFSLLSKLRSVAEDLAAVQNINLQIDATTGELPADYGFAHPKENLDMSFARQHLGIVSRFHPAVAEAVGLSQSDAAILLFDVDALVDASSKTRFKFKVPPKYPAVKVDVAIAVPKEINFESVRKVVAAAAGKLLDDLVLFDLYSGEGLPDNFHSMAFSVSLRAEDRTLGNKEEQKFINKVSKGAEQLGGNLRS